MGDLAKKYEHQVVESEKYQTWVKKGYFRAKDKNKPPFTVVIPPPNVTGKLHLGHTWDETLQDLIIRRKRMQGYDALYLPGMDHAGIATQAKVDQVLREQGKDRLDLGREAYLDIVWKWAKDYSKTIRDQWAAIGISVDYERERFTLDEGLSQAVNEVFIHLYKKGYIYQGERIINWDTEAMTALSNIEVEHRELQGALYYVTYPFVDGPGGVTVATTRPETMFGDTALMIHPLDPRYQSFQGKEVTIPLTKTRIPIIADEYVDREFGTGAVKVTPAHDPNDFMVGKRHHLPMNNCMNGDGTMNELAGEFSGLDRFECRKQVVKAMQDQGIIQKIEPIIHNVGHSERTGAIIEPRLSKQWFVSMKDLAKNALTHSDVRFVPERFQQVFEHWMENVEDWCISRQLWWGHRLPIWYKDDEIFCGDKAPGFGWKQEEDVLDTWFSSALWPFSTLGWPNNTEELERYFPTDVLVTGYDIIFFWVARMIFQSLEFTGKSPFKYCFIHGLIRDSEGRKMSKSLGNGVDPQDVINTYGADSLRYYISTNSSPGLDMRYEAEKVESSWNYINKIWNISRYVLMNTQGMLPDDCILNPEKFRFADQWIMHRLNRMLDQADQFFDRFEFGEAARVIYNFTWDDFASWYLEMSKLDLDESETKKILITILRTILKLLHPFMPFVTEEIYLQLPKEADSIMVAPWPINNGLVFPETIDKDWFFDLIRKLRQVRQEYNVSYTKPIDLYLVATPSSKKFIEANRHYLEKFVNPGKLEFLLEKPSESQYIPLVFQTVDVFLPLGSLVDIQAECERLEGEIQKLRQEILRSQNLLANDKFKQKAPESKIREEENKYELYQKRLEAALTRIEELKR